MNKTMSVSLAAASVNLLTGMSLGGTYGAQRPIVPHYDATPNHTRFLDQVKAEAKAKRERKISSKSRT